jgi:hypothetical protein
MFMKRYVNIGLSCVTAATVTVAAAALSAQTPEGTAGQTAKPQTTKPAMEQPGMAGTSVNLGTVRIPRPVKADGQALPAGSYQVRVTETQASPPAAGQTPQYERWAEFLRNGKVVGREVVTIVPASDIKQVAEMTPPPSGGSRTEVLKGGDYLRLWINRGGNHYLIHFNI